jgi:hypothetical protein
LKRFRLQGTVVSSKLLDKQPKFNFFDKRQLARILTVDWHIPLAVIADWMSVEVCIRMLRKYIMSIGYNSRVVAKKPLLKDAYKLQRLAFAWAMYIGLRTIGKTSYGLKNHHLKLADMNLVSGIRTVFYGLLGANF